MGRIPTDRGHRALRRGRVSLPNRYYVVTTVTARRRPLFRDFMLGRAVVRALRAVEPIAPTQCYVVMPDHLHWLMALRGGTTLSALVQRIKAGSAREIGRLAPSARPVWARGFHDRALRDDDALRTVARYIVANPLRAGLVEHIGDYSLWDAVWVEDGRAGD